MSLKTISSSILILIIGILIGVSSSYFYARSILPMWMIEAIRTGQIGRGVVPIPASAMNTTREMLDFQKKSIAGQIISFSGNTMTVKTQSTNPAISGSQSERTFTVNIDSKTKLVSMIQKDSVSFQKEMEEFQNLLEEKRVAMKQPSLMKLQDVGREAFVSGKRIGIKSIEDITQETTTVTAASVVLYPEMSAQVPVPAVSPVQ